MKNRKVLIPFILTCLIIGLLFPSLNVCASGEKEIPENGTVHVDGGNKLVKILNVTYDNNTYVSLRDMASAMNGTPKQFDVSVSSKDIIIKTGTPYGARGGENEPFDEEDLAFDSYYRFNLKTNDMTIDGREVKRYTLLGSVFDGVYDCFINVSELALELNVKMWFDNNELYVDTSSDFEVDPYALEENEFFRATKSALVGDATTGDILFESSGDDTVLIASTSKLMTYLCIMDAISEGRMGANDELVISEGVSKLSYGEDGVIRLEPGQVTNVPEVMRGMLLSSSNECARALAEHAYGNESAFVEVMNAKAKSIGMSENTKFYNANGLPFYTDDAVPSKVQNRSSAEDMFKLVKYILAVYPQISDITSLKEASLPTLDTLAKNTNPLLYNVPGTFGLKTGTTNGAMCCLITAANISCDDGNHTIVSMVFGSESYVIRGLTSELLLEYGKRVVTDKFEGATKKDETIPSNAEELIQAILKMAR